MWLMNSNFSKRYTKKKSLCLYNNTTSLNHCSSEWYLSQRRVSTVYGNKTKRRPSITIVPNIQLLLCGAQYVTQVSLNYNLVYILKLVYIYIYIYIYIYSPNRRLVYSNLRFWCICVNIYLSASLMHGFTISIYTVGPRLSEHLCATSM